MLEGSTGAYRLTGNVRIARGNLVVQADEARSYTNAQGEVERIELFGQPTYWNDVLEDGEPVDGHSDQIIVNFLADTITMVGSAEIRMSKGEFSGNKLTYDMASKDLVGEGGVRVVIEPAATQSVLGDENESEQARGDDDPPE